MKTPSIPISWGELIDKITILEIKAARLSREDQRENVRRELVLLRAFEETLGGGGEWRGLRGELLAVNRELWDIEERIREKDRRGEFDAEFIALARSVYGQNDRRAALKRAINIALSSELIEEKSYGDWSSPPDRRPAS